MTKWNYITIEAKSDGNIWHVFIKNGPDVDSSLGSKLEPDDYLRALGNEG